MARSTSLIRSSSSFLRYRTSRVLVLRPWLSYVGGGDGDLYRLSQQLVSRENVAEGSPFAFRRDKVVQPEFAIDLFHTDFSQVDPFRTNGRGLPFFQS